MRHWVLAKEDNRGHPYPTQQEDHELGPWSMPAINVEPHIEPTMTITKKNRQVNIFSLYQLYDLSSILLYYYHFILMINYYYYYYCYFYYSLMTCHLSPDFPAFLNTYCCIKPIPVPVHFSFVTDEDPRGRNVLLELSFLAT